MFTVALLPGLLFGSVAGDFVDRWNRRRTLIVADLLSVLALLPLLLVHSADTLWIVYPVVFLAGTIEQFFAPTERALLPTLVADRYLVPANVLSALNMNLARLIGPPLGGLVAGIFGLGGIVLVDASSFVFAAFLIALTRVPATSRRSMLSSHATDATDAESAPPAPAGFLGEWLDGLRLIFRLQPLRVLLVSLLLTSLGEGVFGTLLPPFVSKILHGGAPEFGYLMAAQAVGGLLGGLLIGRAAKDAPAKVLIGLGSLGLGPGDLAIFNYPAFYPKLAPGLVLFALVGVPAVCASIGVSTLVQRVVGEAYRGRVFASAGAVAAFASLLGAAGAGLLGDRLGILFVLNTQGIVYILAGLLALTALRGVPPKAGPVVSSRAAEVLDAVPSSGMPL